MGRWRGFTRVPAWTAWPKEETRWVIVFLNWIILPFPSLLSHFRQPRCQKSDIPLRQSLRVGGMLKNLEMHCEIGMHQRKCWTAPHSADSRFRVGTLSLVNQEYSWDQIIHTHFWSCSGGKNFKNHKCRFPCAWLRPRSRRMPTYRAVYTNRARDETLRVTSHPTIPTLRVVQSSTQHNLTTITII